MAGSTVTYAQDGGFLNGIRSLFGKEKVEPVADAVPYKPTVNVPDAARSLRKAITAASNLYSMRKSPPSGAAGLLRRARADIDQITGALYSNGYYAGSIRITIAGRALDAPDILQAIEAARPAGPVPVEIDVTTGPLFHFGSITLVDERNRPLPMAPTLRQLGIEPGGEAKSSAILDAESHITDFYRDKGHAFAKVVDKDVVADHATNLVNVTYVVNAGPAVAFGPVTVSGAEKVRPSFVQERVRIIPGEMFSPQRLADTRKSLLRYEAFSGVRIREGDKLDADGRLPVDVEVTERKPRYVGFGAKYSSTDGSSINAFWGHRNLFGGAETLRLDGQVSWFGGSSSAVPDSNPLGYRFAATFGKPGILTPIDDLVAQAAVLREVTDAYVREAVTFTGGVRRNYSDQFSVQIGLDLEQSHVQDSSGSRDDTIVGVPIDIAYDTTDNPLDPSKGIRAAGTFEPFAYLGQASAGPMMFKGSLSSYKALDEDKRYILAGRISAGTIFGADLLDVPPQRRFYVGGGGSLRGYDYQSASPRNAQGDIIGGLSYLTASAEARIKVTDTIGIVPFFDMGAASEGSVPDLGDLKYSAGLGLRYYTGIGPVRLDVAIPLNPEPDDKGYGIYISLGQSF
ncbi:autotransporter assembly complex family protein [Kaistia sp. 32K]|uniref:autotransporter assembly complex protein TamA n=1 Tax=Kaistia sp. 32K TaxID=2795690 RepID=UPI001FD001D5|nr:autotransporter assembly complex family protein [Kaistia sp. 32K]